MQCVSPFKPAPTDILKLAGLPEAFFNLTYFFLVLEEEVRGFAVAHNLSGEQQVTDMVKGRLKPVEIVSAVLESPKIILCVLRSLPLIMVRDRIQWSPILRTISRDDPDDVGIWSHNYPGVPRRNTPPPVVGDNAGYIIGPAIEIKA